MGRRGALGPRVVVGGVSGSGKSTLARELARRMDVSCIELDALFHKPGWEQSTDDEFEAKIRAALAAAGDAWVVDGNYSRLRHVTWENATGFVWLDYPRGLATWRATKRTIRRLATRQELWHGNRERLSNLLDPGHPIRWSWSQHPGARAKNEAALADPRYAHLHVVRIRRPSDLRDLLRYAPGP